MRKRIGKFPLSRVHHVLLRGLPKGHLARRVLLAVAMSPERKGWCGSTIERIAKECGGRADRVSRAMRNDLTGHLQVRNQSGRIIKFRVLIDWSEVPLPTGKRGERLVRFFLARTDSRKTAERLARAFTLADAMRDDFVDAAREVLKREGRMTGAAVIELFTLAHAGRITTRAKIGVALGMSTRAARRHIAGSERKDRYDKPVGVVISAPTPTENVRVENPKLSLPKMSGSTRAHAYPLPLSKSPRTETGEGRRQGKMFAQALQQPTRSGPRLVAVDGEVIAGETEPPEWLSPPDDPGPAFEDEAMTPATSHLGTGSTADTSTDAAARDTVRRASA